MGKKKGSIVLSPLVKRIGVSRKQDFHWISLWARLVYYQQCPSVCANGNSKVKNNVLTKKAVLLFSHTKIFSISCMRDFPNIPICWCACFVIGYKVSTLVMSEYFGKIQPPFLSNMYSKYHNMQNNRTLYAIRNRQDAWQLNNPQLGRNENNNMRGN